MDPCAFDQVDEFERAAERAVTLHAFLHVAGNLDAQKSALLRGSNLRIAMEPFQSGIEGW